MEVEETRLGDGDFSSCVNSIGNGGIEKDSGSIRGSENLGVDLLEDLDSYLEDIDDRLVISRMVSDSVIKGMVKAVEQVALERISAKECEIMDSSRLLKSQVTDSELSSTSTQYQIFSDGIESLGGLRSLARGQIKKLKKEIDSIRGSNSMVRIGSGSELLGLGGILQEKTSGSLVDVGGTLNSLETTLDNMCSQMDHMVCLAKSSVCERQEEQELQKELEAMVIQSSLSSLREEFEKKLWEQNVSFCGSQQTNWQERINEISDLKKELDAIAKSLSPDNTQLVSHGSHDMKHFHRKTSSSQISPSPVLEGNGISEEHSNGMPENWDAAQLKHLSNDELVNYFNSVITMMRRNHESKVQEMTEEYFTLKRDFLREKGSNSLPLRKDKDLDALRKKIPLVILKLDDILVESEKLIALSNNDTETLCSLHESLHSLLSENRQLRDSLLDKEKEMKLLTSKVSNTTEEKLQKLIENLKSLAEDAEIKASLSEEVYKCVLRELTPGIMCKCEELELQSIFMQEICEVVYREAAKEESRSKYEVEDVEVESLLMQGLGGMIFKEAIKDMQSQVDDFNSAYITENELRASLEQKVLEKEKELVSANVENERLKEEIQLLEASLEEKDKFALELAVTLAEEREKSELASHESNSFKDLASCLQTMVSDKTKELDSLQCKLAEALKQIEEDKVELNKLNQNLELMIKELSNTRQHMSMLAAVNQEQANNIRSLQAKEAEHRKQMQAVIALVLGLPRALSDLEHRVSDGIEKHKLRLKESRSQLSYLIQKSNVLKSTSLLYKQKFERKCTDLQLAEAEVDLLGDEVDTLLRLLEKIYIALDHYSPILQHYPGIIEILKLVRRELNGVSTKST